MLDVLVIGVGQAGLAVGYQLHKRGVNFLIIGREKEIGNTWRERYDSLSLFTSREFSSLPGLALQGEKHGFPTKDEIANYLADYALSFQLPIQLETNVEELAKHGEYFTIQTSKGLLTAKQVIVATGPFQEPTIPSNAKNLSAEIRQMHSSQYRNVDQLQPGNVLVVGGGNSGAQIAVELAATREVHLSVSYKLRYLPLVIGGKSIFWWFQKLGILKATSDSWLGKRLRSGGDPIFGFKLKKLIRRKKIVVHPRTINCERHSFTFYNQDKLEVKNVIWATGFHLYFPWILIGEIFDTENNLIHERGTTTVEGLYFVGLPWQHKRGSALLLGVGEDAAYIADRIINKK
ncbi:flavin-containing monooxygenase [Aquibacillus kalidii]|uniref:flavin-containing monooxygenase n=1 Tax=Aquibacillus kalidii TaxID=2762597 RepID=UPI0016495D16|nr:NAD(P)/FAD-dependent oxidoreductase [Aquibacillus kalidii]